MNVFLTPELKPFYGGTYYPPDNTPVASASKDLLDGDRTRLWTEDRKPASLERASTLHRRSCKSISKASTSDRRCIDRRTSLDKAYDDLSGSYDYHEGGFSGAPKFPRPTALNLLYPPAPALRKANDRRPKSTGRWRWRVKTLRAMANGGMRDHLGGGFHRYSVDGYWHIPHYEKMLYDQAQLLTAYVEGYQLTRLDFSAQHRHADRRVCASATCAP